MATVSYQTQLESTQSAITKAEAGQRVSVVSSDGSSITFEAADLGALHKREMSLRRAVARETRGGIRVRGATVV